MAKRIQNEFKTELSFQTRRVKTVTNTPYENLKLNETCLPRSSRSSSSSTWISKFEFSGLTSILKRALKSINVLVEHKIAMRDYLGSVCLQTALLFSAFDSLNFLLLLQNRTLPYFSVPCLCDNGLKPCVCALCLPDLCGRHIVDIGTCFCALWPQT